MGILKKIFGTRGERLQKKIQPIVEKINQMESVMKKKKDEEFKTVTIELRERFEKGETLDSLLIEGFAAVREASVRTLGMRHFDVQLLGGIALHRGMIAEMKTGEGKTLVATLPLYLNAIEGKGCHLVTVNDYLAKRDAEWMGPIYNFLGMSVGVIVHGLTDAERKEAYNCDITYGTNNEFGFDYLRDNMKFSIEDYVHRYLSVEEEEKLDKIFNYAIVDEVDSILIDEARTPLIISGPAEESTDMYYRVNAIVPFLRRDEDYVVDEKSHTVTLTESGINKVEKRLNVKNLYESENFEIIHHVTQALRSHTLFKRDVNYLVEDGKVIIIDEFTGRKMPGRRWSDGLHQAVEAKEGLKIQEENQTLATITFQNYFRMYKKLAGMTGTADTEAEEFAKIYNLDVFVIPTHKLMIRVDNNDVVYTTERAKLKAVINAIKDCHRRGQPTLVGTTSVEKSELVSRLLHKEGIAHNVLNAKNHALEAEIIAQAGRKSAVTISTNMAGRGVDIVLGGNPEGLAKGKAQDKESEEYKKWFDYFSDLSKKEREEVLRAGGLHIIGTERHEARRIDNQLRGRSGRQGDPGSSRFYLSLEDELLRIFGSDRIKRIMERLNVNEDEPIEHRWITKAIENAQKKVEGHNFDIRKHLLEYDDVMNQQRKTIYKLRRKILSSPDVHEYILNAIEEVGWILVEKYCSKDIHPEEWDLEGLSKNVRMNMRVDISYENIDRNIETIAEFLINKLIENYEEKTKRIVDGLVKKRGEEGEEGRGEAIRIWREFEKAQCLREIDTHWKSHLLAMDHLREGVHLEAYGQKDPKIIYKKEGFEYFTEMLDLIHQAIVKIIFNVEVKDESEVEREKMRRRPSQMYYGRGSPTSQGGRTQEWEKPTTYRRPTQKVGRNDPCPCGSGKKYKKCCLSKDIAAAG